jgi:quercetin dioxygenase-like cupin family protein
MKADVDAAGHVRPRYHVASLRDNHRAVDPEVLNEVFRAPWRTVRLVGLEAGEQLGPRTLSDSEVLVFVTEGTGRARLHSGVVELRPGVSLTLLKDELLDLAADDGLEAFFVEMGTSS